MNFMIGIAILTQQIGFTNGQGDTLVQPATLESSGSTLSTTLTLEYADITIPNLYTLENTRLFNGTLPGPTLRLNAGDKLSILFQNELAVQADAVSTGDNEYHKPDHSNLHYHGAHVSGELPSDDVRMSVAPGDSYQYETDFPDNHLPGTHWIHPHLHGSSALQVGGGAAMALIVMDPDDFLPTQIEEAQDILLIVQNIDEAALNEVVTDINDGMLNIDMDDSAPDTFRLVNGQYQPVVNMQPGEWQRWRIIYGNWLEDALDFAFQSSPSCEMYLLAKDGIYIDDYPRDVSSLPIPSGGRADIMVRCSDEGTHIVQDFEGQTLMTVEVAGTDVGSTDLETWSPEYPAYLTSLTSTAPSDGCGCATVMEPCDSDRDKTCINQNLFDADVYVHTVEFGSVVERELNGVHKHPYHQHVYPFQLVSGVEGLKDPDQDTYFKTGDWQDTLYVDVAPDQYVNVRYTADVHDGVVMVHCHMLNHEDLGAMAQELVVDGGSCECDALYSEPVTAMPSIPPSVVPSTYPTDISSNEPSVVPTASPTSVASILPTIVSSSYPTGIPSISTTDIPSNKASVVPTVNPTSMPSILPTVIKSVSPSHVPTDKPSTFPSLRPSYISVVDTDQAAKPGFVVNILGKLFGFISAIFDFFIFWN